MTPPPTDQIITAHKLAVHYGHEWGKLSPDIVAGIAAEAWTTGEITRLISEACTANWRAWQDQCPPESRMDEGQRWVGIDAPYFDVDGDITHETLTGRLEWLVDPDGSAGVVVMRPYDDDEDGCVVAEAAVSPSGALTNLDVPSDEELGREGARVRHLHALADWMRVLGVRVEALDSYFARAEEYEATDRLRRMKAALNALRGILGEVTTLEEFRFLADLAAQAVVNARVERTDPLHPQENSK